MSKLAYLTMQRRVGDAQRHQQCNALRARVAMHEAAHTVVAWATGMRVALAEVAFDRGHVETPDLNDLLDAGAIVPVLALKYAGDIAERRRYGNAELCQDDYQSAGTIAAEHGGGDLLSRGLHQAGEILDRHWREVERVAAALLERGRLDGDDIVWMLGDPPATRSRPAPVERTRMGTMSCVGAEHLRHRVEPETITDIVHRGRIIGEVIRVTDNAFLAWSEIRQQFIGDGHPTFKAAAAALA